MRIISFLFLSSVLSAQVPEPVIRVTTRLVTVSVVVRSKGAPVTDLTARDFEVFDHGKPQKISFFSMNSVKAASSPAAARTPKSVFTNRGEGRAEAPSTATVILVDGLNTEFTDQSFARDHIRRFLGGLDSSEQIAIYTLGRRLNVLHDFSDDRDHLAKAIARFRGEIAGEFSTPETDLGVIEMLDKLGAMKNALKNEQVYREGLRVERTIAALDAIANHLARLPGRKNLIWISGSFPIYPGFKVTTSKFGTSRQKSFVAEVERTTRLFSDANMAIYPVDVRGVFTVARYGADMGQRARRRLDDPDNPFHADNRDSMKMLADGTGGVLLKDNNDLSKALRQAIDDAQVTYTLGYYPEAETLDGKYHELRVKVARQGVDVRHRKGYFAAKDTALGPEERKAVLRDTLWSPLDASAIEIVARLDPNRGAFDLSLAINPETFALEQKQDRWVGGLDVYVEQCDTVGKELETTRDSIDLNLTAGHYAKRQENWLALSKSVRPKSEAIQLKVIVQDKLTGALGSVHIPLSRFKK